MYISLRKRHTRTPCLRTPAPTSDGHKVLLPAHSQLQAFRRPRPPDLFSPKNLHISAAATFELSAHTPSTKDALIASSPSNKSMYCFGWVAEASLKTA